MAEEATVIDSFPTSTLTSTRTSTIGYPKQSDWVGDTVLVYSYFDNADPTLGKIVRDDEEEPYRTIIELEDGNFILSTECQFKVI